LILRNNKDNKNEYIMEYSTMDATTEHKESTSKVTATIYQTRI